MKKAIVSQDGTVVNIIEIEEGANYSVANGFRLIDFDTDAEIGGAFANSIFTRPLRVPDLKSLRFRELKDKFNLRTATLNEVQEFLSDHI